MTVTDHDDPAVAWCSCPEHPPCGLSARHLQILHGMAEGYSNARIGRDLHLSEDTIKAHARGLFRRLGARDRAHAVALAYRQGILTVGEDRPPPPALPSRRSSTVWIERSERGVQTLARAVFGDRGSDPHFEERCRVAITRLAGGVS